MKRLLKDGLITTVLGLIILGFTGTLIWQEKYSPEMLSGWFALGLTLLRSKDSLIGITKQNDEDGI